VAQSCVCDPVESTDVSVCDQWEVQKMIIPELDASSVRGESLVTFF
jgi:hypothetical protein